MCRKKLAILDSSTIQVGWGWEESTKPRKWDVLGFSRGKFSSGRKFCNQVPEV